MRRRRRLLALRRFAAPVGPLVGGSLPAVTGGVSRGYQTSGPFSVRDAAGQLAALTSSAFSDVPSTGDVPTDLYWPEEGAGVGGSRQGDWNILRGINIFNGIDIGFLQYDPVTRGTDQ